MGLSARVTRVVGQIGDRWLVHGARSVSETVPARVAVAGGRNASLCSALTGRGFVVRSYCRSLSAEPCRAGGGFGRCRCSVECARLRGHGRPGLRCNAADWRMTGRRPAQIDSQESARPLRRHVRPVLKHGPRSLTCERAIEIVESQTRNESEVSSDGTSGDPSSSVAAAHPRATPSAGLLFGALLRRGPRAHTLGPERW